MALNIRLWRDDRVLKRQSRSQPTLLKTHLFETFRPLWPPYFYPRLSENSMNGPGFWPGKKVARHAYRGCALKARRKGQHSRCSVRCEQVGEWERRPGRQTDTSGQEAIRRMLWKRRKSIQTEESVKGVGQKTKLRPSDSGCAAVPGRLRGSTSSLEAGLRLDRGSMNKSRCAGLFPGRGWPRQSSADVPELEFVRSGRALLFFGLGCWF